MKEERNLLDEVLTDAKRPGRSPASRAEFVIMQLLSRPWVAGGLCFGILCCFAVAGLWPFRQIPNQVTWIEGRPGIQFGKYGIALSAGALPNDGSGACTIEMWVEPAGDEKSGTLLDFFGPGTGDGFALQRSLSDLRLDRKVEGGRPIRHYIPEVLQNGRPVFITATIGSSGTVVYLNGMRARELPRFRAAPRDCLGNLAVGHAARGHTNWDGEIRGLAIYKHELTPDQVVANYRSWTTNGRPETREGAFPTVLYLFNEGTGRAVRDHGLAGLELMIPEKYQDLDRVWLESPHMGFQPTAGYVEDVLINISGFIPFGFMFSAFLVSLGGFRKAALWAIVAGFAVSMTIESLQAYLPTRDSDLTDVVFNTLGASAGAWLYMIWSARLAKSDY